MVTTAQKRKEREEPNPLAKLINEVASLVQAGKGPSKVTMNELLNVARKGGGEIEVDASAVRAAEALARELEAGRVKWPTPKLVKRVV